MRRQRRRMKIMEGIPKHILQKHRERHAARERGDLRPPVRTVVAGAVPATEAGPGTELRKLLHHLGIQPKGRNCKCNEHARLMDQRGPEWCADNIEQILDWLEAEASTRPIVGILFSRAVARELVKLAIKRSRTTLTSLADG